jgi:hypothetical protein
VRGVRRNCGAAVSDPRAPTWARWLGRTETARPTSVALLFLTESNPLTKPPTLMRFGCGFGVVGSERVRRGSSLFYADRYLMQELRRDRTHHNSHYVRGIADSFHFSASVFHRGRCAILVDSVTTPGKGLLRPRLGGDVCLVSCKD